MTPDAKEALLPEIKESHDKIINKIAGKHGLDISKYTTAYTELLKAVEESKREQVKVLNSSREEENTDTGLLRAIKRFLLIK